MREIRRYVVSYRNSTSNHNVASPYFYEVKVVSYRNSTSNHNRWGSRLRIGLLYLIEILHQTTTESFSLLPPPGGCILSKFYIKPQPYKNYYANKQGCILSKFYIKPQPKISSVLAVVGCILSKFYIKPQLLVANVIINRGCILSKFYIKPQQCPLQHYSFCVVSYRNSTSNHNHTTAPSNSLFVVSYRNSTSNHNGVNATMSGGSVVSYRNSTSNHNSASSAS